MTSNNSLENSDIENKIEIDELNKIHIDTSDEIMPKSFINSNLACELFLKKIAEKSLGYKWMHNQDSYYYENINYFLKILDIVIAACLATITCGELFLLGFISGNQDVFYYVTLSIQIAFMFCNFIIRGIREFTDYNLIAENHRTYAIKFGLINNEIQEKFTHKSKNNKDDEYFIKDITKTYNELLDRSPPIRKKILNKYIKASEDNEINKQLIVGGYDKIEIIIDNDKVKTNLKITDTQQINSDDRYKYEMHRWLRHV